MTRGIRKFAVEAFAENIHLATAEGNAQFRRKVINDIINKFDITPESAATNYQYALSLARVYAPEHVSTIGRALDKRGGRKPVSTVAVVDGTTNQVVATGLSKSKAKWFITSAELAGNHSLMMLTESNSRALMVV